MTWRCTECDLPDPAHGQGDGIGSCACPRCDWCGGPPVCDCEADDYEDYPMWERRAG